MNENKAHSSSLLALLKKSSAPQVSQTSEKEEKGESHEEVAMQGSKPQQTTGFGAFLAKPKPSEPKNPSSAIDGKTAGPNPAIAESKPAVPMPILGRTCDQIFTKNVQSFQAALAASLKNTNEQKRLQIVRQATNPNSALRILQGEKPRVIPTEKLLASTPLQPLKPVEETKPTIPEATKIAQSTILESTEANSEHVDRLDTEHASVHLKYAKDIQLDASQKEALEGLRWEQFGCLIGAAGTGKTTVTKILVSILEETTPQINLNKARVFVPEDAEPEYNVAIAFCAFTGRAVQQMKRALPEKYHPLCQTIHSLLGFAPVYYEELNEKGELVNKMRFEPTFTAARKLPYKVIVMDESGMTPIALWNQLWDACQPDVRIIMIGDINQLPPVQGRSVLGFAMTKWPTFELKEIWRQKIKQADGSYISAEANPITEAAWQVLAGQSPKAVPGKFDIMNIPDGSNGAYNNIIATVSQLNKLNKFDPLTDGLIVPKNVGPIGQQALNERLVSFFNPSKKIGGVVINKPTVIQTGMGTVVYRLGDKVMLLQNDREKNLTNGMTGVIVDIKMNGLFQDNRAQFDPKQTHAGPMVSLDFEKLGEHLENEFSAINGTDSNGDNGESKEKEEPSANQRQASHIVTVRFGQADEEIQKEIDVQKENVKKAKEEYAYRHIDSYALEIEEKKLLKLEEKHAAIAQEISVSTSGSFRKIALAYAFTCHKSQGGEYPTVVIVCHASDLRMLTREWLYTAITRARTRCILLCNRRGLSQALRIQRIKGKSTAEKIASFVKLQEEVKDLTVPNLPEARNLQPVN